MPAVLAPRPALYRLLPLALLALPLPALATAAAPAPTLDSGDTAWMLTSSLLVLLMTLPSLIAELFPACCVL